MLNMNRVTLLGHAGRDPEIRNLQNGGKAASFTLATTEKWKGKDGKPAESTEWHRIAVYGPTVEAVEKMLKQGRRGPGRGEDRVARIPRQGWQRPCGDRVRGGRVAGHGQRPVRAACEPGSRSGPGSRIAGCRGRRRCAGIPGMSRCFAPLAAFVLAAVLWSGAASGQSCTGRFVNPISDVCWECLFPISIGPIRMGQRVGGARHPQSGIADLLLRLADPADRALARGLGAGPADGCLPQALVFPQSRRPHHRSGSARRARGKTGSSGGDGATGSVWHAHYYVYPLLSWIGALLDLGCLEGGSLDIAWTSELDPAWLDDELSFLLSPEAGTVRQPAGPGRLCRRLRGGFGRAAARSDVLVRRLPGRDVSADRQCRGPCRRGAGLAAGGPAPGLPAAPGRGRLGHVRLGCALREIPDAGDEEVAIPLADDPAGPGHDAAHRVQSHGTLLGALGNAAGAAGLGRELRLPAVAQAQLLPSLNPLNRNDKYHSRDTMMTVAPPRRTALALTVALSIAWCLPALADERPPGVDAARLVDEVLRKAGGNGEDTLGDWTRSIIERGLGTRRRGRPTIRRADRSRIARRGRCPASGRTPCGANGGRSRRARQHPGNPPVHQPVRPGRELAPVGAGCGSDRRAPGNARRLRKGSLRATVKRVGGAARRRMTPGSPSIRACSACSG